MDPAGRDRAALLPPGAGYGARRGAQWAVVLVAGAAVVLLAVAAQRAAHSSALVMLEGTPAAWWRGKNHDPPMLAHNGEQCWMCPCCAGCESTPAARAAGCGGPGAAVRHAAIQRRAAGTGKSQAALGRTAAAAPTAAGPSPAAATTAPAVLGAAVHGHSLTMARAAGAAVALPARPLKAAASAADTAATAAPVAVHAKEAALPRKRVAGRAQATMGAHKASAPAASAKRDESNPSWKEEWRPDEIKEPAAAAAAAAAAVRKSALQKKHVQMKSETSAGGRASGANDKAPVSDNANRLADDLHLFEDATFLNPHEHEIPPLTKKIGAHTHEDVIAGAADVFQPRTTLNPDGTAKTFSHYDDPAGIIAGNPAHEEPWKFAAGKHWDQYSFEDKSAALNGKDWGSAADVALVPGAMTHGVHRTWDDVSDAQWGYQHQFSDWDPDGDASKKLMWGAGGLAQTGSEAAGDATRDSATSIFEEPALAGHAPWELSFADPRLQGDDFVPQEDYLQSLRPPFGNPSDNSFGGLDEDSKANNDFVFGDNAGAWPGGAALIKEGKDDPASLRQRLAVPVNDNWNALADSAVDSDAVCVCVCVCVCVPVSASASVPVSLWLCVYRGSRTGLSTATLCIPSRTCQYCYTTCSTSHCKIFQKCT